MELPTTIATQLTHIRRLDPSSHKGQNGKVLLIGGSNLFHAASRWSLDVVSSMVDMVFYASLPENNLLIQAAKGEFWDGVVVPREEVESYLQEADVILIGPGMERDENINFKIQTEKFARPTADEWEHNTYKIINYLLSHYPDKKWVIDAGALQMVEPTLLNSHCIITPHEGELARVITHLPKEQSQQVLLQTGVTILLKGHMDQVFALKREETIAGGNAGMTKGGTGDALAGLIAGLYCFSDDPFAAAVVGSYVNKRAGDELFEQVGPFFKTSELVAQIPRVLKTLLYSS